MRICGLSKGYFDFVWLLCSRSRDADQNFPYVYVRTLAAVRPSIPPVLYGNALEKEHTQHDMTWRSNNSGRLTDINQIID